jgi:hypothetical protein
MIITLKSEWKFEVDKYSSTVLPAGASFDVPADIGRAAVDAGAASEGAPEGVAVVKIDAPASSAPEPSELDAPGGEKPKEPELAPPAPGGEKPNQPPKK